MFTRKNAGETPGKLLFVSQIDVSIADFCGNCCHISTAVSTAVLYFSPN